MMDEEIVVRERERERGFIHPCLSERSVYWAVAYGSLDGMDQTRGGESTLRYLMLA